MPIKHHSLRLVLVLSGVALFSGCGGGGGGSSALDTGVGDTLPVTDTDPSSGTPSQTVDPTSLGAASVSWLPPTQNSDGSHLADLSGYRIYYGTAEGVYSQSVDLQNPGLSEYLFENLPSGKTYYFVVTAYNSQGAESEYSNPLSKAL